MTRSVERNDTVWGVLRRAFHEFLTLPMIVVAIFFATAILTYVLDQARLAPLEWARSSLQQLMFGSATTTSEFLTTIANSIITVTSITISLLLLAVQQNASALTHQVFDQFLRRSTNQLFFGYFIGLSAFTLITLATVDEQFNPVFGAALAMLLTIVALVLLLMLLYATIDQMRPEEIIDSIHKLTLRAREHQLPALRRTQRAGRAAELTDIPVQADSHGHVTLLDMKILERVCVDNPGLAIAIAVPIGAFVATGDTVAHVSATAAVANGSVTDAVRRAVRIERRRDIETDASFGIGQLGMIAWTSISTAKSNPDPGLVCIRSLRDILTRWSSEDCQAETGRTLPVTYPDDVMQRLMDTFESLTVAASESMQHQCLAEILNAFVLVFDRLPGEQQAQIEEIALRSLSALGDHVPTRELNEALLGLASKLTLRGRHSTAAAVESARVQLDEKVGRLNSRSTRGGRQGQSRPAADRS